MGSTHQLVAKPNAGWHFTAWANGSTQNPRTITVPLNGATYTAEFEQQTATVTGQAKPAAGGSVSGGGTYAVGSTHQLTARPNAGWKFATWANGRTQNPRAVTVGPSGGTYTAEFVRRTAAISGAVSPQSGGKVSGGGTYVVGSSHQLTALPNAGWKFKAWANGSTENPRTVTVPAAGATYTAKFVQTPQGGAER